MTHSVVRNNDRLNKHGKIIVCNPPKPRPTFTNKVQPRHNRMVVTVDGLTRIYNADGKTIFLGTMIELLGLTTAGSSLYFAR